MSAVGLLIGCRRADSLLDRAFHHHLPTLSSYSSSVEHDLPPCLWYREPSVADTLGVLVTYLQVTRRWNLERFLALAMGSYSYSGLDGTGRHRWSVWLNWMLLARRPIPSPSRAPVLRFTTTFSVISWRG